MAFLFTPRSVQLVARMIKTLTSMRNSRFRATRITHGTLFNSFGHSQFRATSCTLQFTKIEI